MREKVETHEIVRAGPVYEQRCVLQVTVQLGSEAHALIFCVEIRNVIKLDDLRDQGSGLFSHKNVLSSRKKSRRTRSCFSSAVGIFHTPISKHNPENRA